MKEMIQKELLDGKCSLGIEFGSTRIKAVLIDSKKDPIASGAHDWENRNDNGVWTYTLDDIREGLQHAYAELKKDVSNRFGVTLTTFKAIGISAMMHGYMAFDKEGKLLTPFRTWRNTITADESEELTELFDYPIPQRWTASHFLLEIKNRESYLPDLDYICTLAGYVHRVLTGKKVLGVGDASGMFPIDTATCDWDDRRLDLFNGKYLGDYPYELRDILPEVLSAGTPAGTLTAGGARFLDPAGDLEEGVPFCPPEGDAGTGMVATNSVLPKTGNVSAGTSAFAMVVLEKPLSEAYRELDLVTTPDGALVAMAHTNNCTGNYDSWFKVFREVLTAMGVEVDKGKFYDTILRKSLEADADCGGLLSYNYIAGEPIVGLNDAMPMVVKTPNAKFSLANFVRSELYAAVAAMRVGLDILFDREGVELDVMNCHGGYFKTSDVGLRMMGSALRTEVRALTTAGEGGAWGIALLADYVGEKESLPLWLSTEVFVSAKSETFTPGVEDIRGFERFYRRYLAGIEVERAAVKALEG